MDDLLRIAAVFALIAANAFFVVGEYAVVTARRARLRARADGGHRGAQSALRLMDDPVRVISTVQVGITALGILTGAIGEPLIREVLGDGIPQTLSFLIAFALVTYLSVVFGELVPKALTLDRAETLAALVARPVELISIALRPIVWLLERSAAILLKPFGVREVVAGEGIGSPEELRALVDEAEQSGVIDEPFEQMLHNVFDFGDRSAAEVMVPAHAVSWLEADDTVAAALERATQEPHGRYPVGSGSLDRLVGVVHIRDLVAAREQPQARVSTIASPALVVPETKPIGELLTEQRETQQQLAVVSDEYGKTVGIVAVEDIVEEIVGEIVDEHDAPTLQVSRADDGSVEAPGAMPIADFNTAVGTDLPHDGVRTLGGLVMDRLGRAAREGDEVDLGGASAEVLELDGNRVVRLRVHTG